MTTEVILTGTGSRTPSLAGSAPGPSWKAGRGLAVRCRPCDRPSDGRGRDAPARLDGPCDAALDL